ncbi:MAG: CDP-glycerol glycerophosphotransferase family protein [Prevotellaceae bacterium]|nr:CDP-glycerol glycerophosphotransferase family protein [Prevotellaceae bacterium]
MIRSWQEDDRENIKRYLEKKGYAYIVADERVGFRKEVCPDIIFYQKPYNNLLLSPCFYVKNLYALFCYVPYAFHSVDEKWAHDTQLLNIAWQVYFENEQAMQMSRLLMRNKCRNGVVLGLPMTDEYLVSSGDSCNPWRPQEHLKKRIIWAPHHSIDSENWIVYSTFLEYADFMLLMAKKYSDKVQFAFKPHPLLRGKLNRVWGEQRTSEYYRRWVTMSNTQLEEGKYVDLFKTSDAMIHDCGSFTIEYHYTHNPVMYIIRGEVQDHVADLNAFAKQAFYLHYLAKSENDIEQFIRDVIDGVDPRKEERMNFYRDFLMPPFGRTASENIIRAILGDLK